MNDGIGLAEVLLGLPGFRVLEVTECDVEVVITIESMVVRVFCSTCGVRAEPQDRMPVAIRDLPCFGRLGWCGSSDDDGAASRSARPRRGPSTPSTSTPRRC